MANSKAPDDLAADLAAEVEALAPDEQLRLAAELLVARQPRLALAIIKKVHDELDILQRKGLF